MTSFGTLMILHSISDDDLKQRLDNHELWIKSELKQGECIYLEGYDLSNKDLSNRKLEGSIFRNCNFQFANLNNTVFLYADLSESDFENTDLSHTEFHHVKMNNTKFPNNQKPIPKSNNLRFDFGWEERREYLHQMALAQHHEKKLAEITSKYEEKLNDDIQKAINTLSESVNNTKNQIDRNTKLAEKIHCYALIAYVITFLFLFMMPYALFNSESLNIMKQAGSLIIIFYTLPIIVSLVVGTTLLRHHKKLQDEIRHYSDNKQRIELYTGLLDSSQYAARGFKNQEFVQETFRAIRNQLLTENSSNQSNGQSITDEQYSLDKIMEALKVIDLKSK